MEVKEWTERSEDQGEEEEEEEDETKRNERGEWMRSRMEWKIWKVKRRHAEIEKEEGKKIHIQTGFDTKARKERQQRRESKDRKRFDQRRKERREKREGGREEQH